MHDPWLARDRSTHPALSTALPGPRAAAVLTIGLPPFVGEIASRRGATSRMGRRRPGIPLVSIERGSRAAEIHPGWGL
jgi:hypothetical protein